MSSKRNKFEHEGRTVYEWEQSLDEVTIFVTPPKGIRGKDLFVDIGINHLRLGIKGNPPFLDVYIGFLFS
jgi:hypothetical protein